VLVLLLLQMVVCRGAGEFVMVMLVIDEMLLLQLQRMMVMVVMSG